METYYQRGMPKSDTFYYTDDALFIILDIKEQGSEKIQEELTHFLQKEKHKIHNLISFEKVLRDLIKKAKASQISVSAGFIKQDIFYLLTAGDGCVYLDRESVLTLLLKGDTSASGYAHMHDTFLFALSGKHVYEHTDIHKIRSKELEQDYILVEFKDGKTILPTLESETVKESPLQPTEKKTFLLAEKIKLLYEDLQNRSQQAAPRKKITFLLLLVVIPIFIWSVVLGYQRRVDTMTKDKIAQTHREVSSYLKQAEEAAFFDPAQAADYIDKAKEKSNALEKEVGEIYVKETAPIVEEIRLKEELIMKQESKQEVEFFDLSIDSQDATGDMITVENDLVAIGDKTNSKIYILSLSKKSLDTIKAPGFGQATQLRFAQEKPYYLIPAKGVYVIDPTEKKIIEQDKEWGDQLFMNTFNSNIYILDSEKNDIYKYSPIEAGYGPKTSYFQGTIPSLLGANSLAIDGSVFVGLENEIYKFTSGLQENFSSTTPSENDSFDKVVTTTDNDKVYAWNKEKGRIVLFGKEGGYVKAITSPSLTKIQDFVVYENTAYLLKGNKILSIDLNE